MKESSKTKNEIKSVTRELVNIVGLLNRKVDVIKAYHSIQEATTYHGKRIAQSNETNETSLKPTNTVGIQTSEDEILQDTARQREDVTKEMHKEVENRQ